MKQELLISEEMTELHQITIELATVSESLKNLTQQIAEIKIELKEMRGNQQEKIINLEKEVSVLKEKMSLHDWLYKLILGIATTALLGSILGLVLKS